jgi:hypothetical protein
MTGIVIPEGNYPAFDFAGCPWGGVFGFYDACSFFAAGQAAVFCNDTRQSFMMMMGYNGKGQ